MIRPSHGVPTTSLSTLAAGQRILIQKPTLAGGAYFDRLENFGCDPTRSYARSQWYLSRGCIRNSCGRWLHDPLRFDGAGSSRFSRIGSELACREIVSQLSQSCDDKRDALRDADEAKLANTLGEAMSFDVHRTLETFHNVAKMSGVSLTDLRCTLLVTLLYEGQKASAVVVGRLEMDSLVSRVNRASRGFQP